MQQFIDTILSEHGLRPARNISRPANGRNNPIYIIDDTFVVRFDGLTDSTGPEYSTRFQAEQWVCDRLESAGLPVPRILVVDNSTRIAPPYMLMSKLPGQSVINSEDLTQAQRLDIAFELGQFLARMHNVTRFDHFGKWHQLNDGTYQTRFSQWPIGFFTQYATWSEQLGGAADAGIIRDLRQLIVGTQPYFDAVTHGVIAHRDCHFENVIQYDGKLTGVLDFEWWMSADPATDFAVEHQWDFVGAGCRDAVYAGYTTLRELSWGHREKVRVYRLLRDFDDVVTLFAQGEVKKSQLAQAKVRAGLDHA